MRFTSNSEISFSSNGQFTLFINEATPRKRVIVVSNRSEFLNAYYKC